MHQSGEAAPRRRSGLYFNAQSLSFVSHLSSLISHLSSPISPPVSRHPTLGRAQAPKADAWPVFEDAGLHSATKVECIRPEEKPVGHLCNSAYTTAIIAGAKDAAVPATGYQVCPSWCAIVHSVHSVM